MTIQNKIQFFVFIFLVFKSSFIFAQCDFANPYHNYGGWFTDYSDNSSITVEMDPGDDIILGIDPKNQGESISYTVCGQAGETFSPSANYTITNPVPNMGDVCAVVATYTNTCGVFVYTWNLVGASCNPTTIIPYYQITSNSPDWIGGDPGVSTTISVNEGDIITLGPQPSQDFLWNWTGCGITNGTNREQVVTVGSTDCTITATFTNFCGATSTHTFILETGVIPCSEAILNPFYQTTGGAKISVSGENSTVVLEVGTEVSFGSSANQTGTWNWSGCGVLGNTNISGSIILTENCTVEVMFTNDCNSDFVSTHTFNITIGTPQVLLIEIASPDFQIDTCHNLIVSHVENISNYNDLSGYTNIFISFEGDEYNFVNGLDSLSFSDSYTVGKNGNLYNLYFSKFPILSINTTENIPDEPKILASFTYSDDSQHLVTPFVGIEKRGGISQEYAKKTYDLEFWEDATGTNSVNVHFGDLRSDDDWILDALYNEPLRIRAYVAHKLWLEIHEPYYLADESNAKSGADVMFVEMFLNGKYNGIYLLSEQVDKKQLKLKSFDSGITKGELYKGVVWQNAATIFADLPPFNNDDRYWSGYDMKYPKVSDTTDWTNLYDFTDFVINSNDDDFENNIWSQFNYGNYLDYFIYLNLTRATDNIGKNIYTAKYKEGEPYFYSPWDLDGVFGTDWTGAIDNITYDIIGNNFHQKVIDLDIGTYKQDVSARWSELRSGVLGNAILENRMLEAYECLKNNKVYEREAIVFPNYPYDQSSFDYLQNWTGNRLAYLDDYFDYFVATKDIEKSKIFLYPNPSTGVVYIHNFDELNNKDYVLYNLVGIIIKRGSLSSNQLILDDSPAGIYILQLENTMYQLILE